MKNGENRYYQLAMTQEPRLHQQTKSVYHYDRSTTEIFVYYGTTTASHSIPPLQYYYSIATTVELYWSIRETYFSIYCSRLMYWCSMLTYTVVYIYCSKLRTYCSNSKYTLVSLMYCSKRQIYCSILTYTVVYILQ